MVKRLIWSSIALDQKKEIFEYWNERNHSKAYSRKLNRLFNEAVEMLTVHSQLGKPTNYPNVRLKFVRDYWIVYQTLPNIIKVLLIWDARRNPDRFENILKDLIT